jgi:hypothetical protein
MRTFRWKATRSKGADKGVTSRNGKNRTLAAYPVQTWPKLTLLVKSRTRGKAVLHTTFGGRGDRNIPLVTLTPMALEIALRDLPNRVTTSFTPVRTEADLTLKWMMAGFSDDLGRLEEDEWGNG